MSKQLGVQMGEDGMPRLVRYSVRHAPTNMIVGGQPFRGGEFIPSAALARATPQQRAMLRGQPRSAPGPAPRPSPAPRPAPAGRRSGTTFVSPETDSGLGLDRAREHARSPKARYFAKVSAEVDRKLGLKSRVESAIGEWAPEGETPGAEPTTATTYSSVRDYDDIKYAAAIKGMLGNQLGAVAFGAEEGGPDAMYTFEASGSMEEIGETLSKHGVPFRTMMDAGEGRTRVMVFDQGSESQIAVEAAAAHHKVEVLVQRGKGEVFPPDARDRKAARKAYKGIMRLYEQAHPDRPHWS